jgi:hypothetical protein
MVEPRSEWVVGKPLAPLRPFVERYPEGNNWTLGTYRGA